MSEEKTKYAVIIYRKLGLEPIILLESEDFNGCFKLWEESKVKWTDCTKEIKPFDITSPVVTAFDPALIFEISLIPIPAQNFKNQTNNPYTREMKQRGLSETLRGYSGGREMLDGGYTPY